MLHYINKDTCSETKQKEYTQYHTARRRELGMLVIAGGPWLSKANVTVLWNRPQSCISSSFRNSSFVKRFMFNSAFATEEACFYTLGSLLAAIARMNLGRNQCDSATSYWVLVTLPLSGLRLLSGWSVVFKSSQNQIVLKEILYRHFQTT